MVMIMCGLGTLLQACRRGPVSSGYLVPIVASAVYVGPALAAVQLGGLPLLAGMLMFAGAVEMALSRALHRLRPFFPPEIAGLVIFLVGTTIAVLGVRDMFGIGFGTPPSLMHGWIAALTLGLMVALQVWGGAWGKLAGPLIGVVLGYAARSRRPRLSMPSPMWPLTAHRSTDLSHLGWAFDPRLMIPFALAALASAVKTMGTIALAQRVNDATWVRLEMKSARRGVLGDGLTTFLGGGLGSVVGANPGSSYAQLVLATGVASRSVAWPPGLLLIAMAFIPTASVLLIQVPKPVSGAVLAFSACYMSSGIQMIASRMRDARKTLVIGLAFGAGMSAEVFPTWRHVPDWLGPVVGSPLVCGMLLGCA
jgi:NCS2 family nucleobase:cation symporter-2